MQGEIDRDREGERGGIVRYMGVEEREEQSHHRVWSSAIGNMASAYKKQVAYRIVNLFLKAARVPVKILNLWSVAEQY